MRPDALEKMPFTLWKGTNGFGDKFELLYLKVPVGTYLEIELGGDRYRSKAQVRKNRGSDGRDGQSPSGSLQWTPIQKILQLFPLPNCKPNPSPSRGR
jgi:hypothetical protein